MKAHRVENIFSEEDLYTLNNIIESYDVPLVDGKYVSAQHNGTGVDYKLGRIQVGDISFDFTENIKNTLLNVIKENLGETLELSHAVYVEYNSKYGQPNLFPHFDGDTHDLIINYQLESNTSWDLGLNTNTYSLKDNSAMIFNGNTEIHWRPKKEFNDGEYVKMIFFRFYNSKNRKDYSYLPNDPNDSIFKEANIYRDSISIVS